MKKLNALSQKMILKHIKGVLVAIAFFIVAKMTTSEYIFSLTSEALGETLATVLKYLSFTVICVYAFISLALNSYGIYMHLKYGNNPQFIRRLEDYDTKNKDSD